MTASVSLEQFAHLKQSVFSYLSEYQKISHTIQSVKDKIHPFLFLFREHHTSALKKLDNKVLPVNDLLQLCTVQTKVILLLSYTATEIQEYSGFERLSNILSKMWLQPNLKSLHQNYLKKITSLKKSLLT